MIPAVLALVLLVQETEDAHRIGHFSISFKERHPLSDLKELCKRQGWKIADVKKAEPDLEGLKIADVSFDVTVPDGYSADKKFGLLVWISPSDSGTAPEAWLEVLAKRNLIVVGAHNSGNGRGVAYRVGYALDAVHNLSKLYSIDKDRIYVTGFSGGG